MSPSMEKEEFLKVMRYFTSCSAAEAEQVLALKAKFPYSQLLHALSARLAKDHGFSNYQQELQLAAVYSADRSVLKEMMTKEPEPWPSSAEVVGQFHSETPESIYTTDHASNNLAEEVINDLQKLTESRQNFEAMFTEEGTPEINQEAPKVVKKKKTGKSKAQRIVELAQGLSKSQGDESDETESADPSDVEDIIEEIAVTKKTIVPNNEKQKEQIEIIDQFIKAQPSIASSRDKTVSAPAGDLSTIKSGEFGDNVISETLVDILLKQGKKDKAVEVLKKLIWKFPQKKAYFAAQIEELKK